MILFGVEMRNDPVLNDAKQIDQNFTAGRVLQVYDPTTGDLVVHPPVGKWLIGWGEQIFASTARSAGGSPSASWARCPSS